MLHLEIQMLVPIQIGLEMHLHNLTPTSKSPLKGQLVKVFLTGSVQLVLAAITVMLCFHLYVLFKMRWEALKPSKIFPLLVERVTKKVLNDYLQEDSDWDSRSIKCQRTNKKQRHTVLMTKFKTRWIY